MAQEKGIIKLMLWEAGSLVRANNYNGVTHEFFGAGVVVNKAKQVVSEAAAGLRFGFAGNTARPTK